MSNKSVNKNNLTRRRFLAYFSSIGLTSTLLPGVLWAKIQEKKELTISKEMLTEAKNLAGLEFTDEERDLMLEGLDEYLEKYEELRKISIANSVPPALNFNPILPGMRFETESKPLKMSKVPKQKAPSNLEEVAFWPVTHLAQLIKSGQVSSAALTKMYLKRLKRYDPQLQCVVTLTEDLALKQARHADKEIVAGKYRGPLHGIPWGAKDLLAAKGYKTTWGAMP